MILHCLWNLEMLKQKLFIAGCAFRGALAGKNGALVRQKMISGRCTIEVSNISIDTFIKSWQSLPFIVRNEKVYIRLQPLWISARPRAEMASWKMRSTSSAKPVGRYIYNCSLLGVLAKCEKHLQSPPYYVEAGVISCLTLDLAVRLILTGSVLYTTIRN